MGTLPWKRERVCAASGCTEKFTPKRRGQKYHSDECRHRAWNEERVSIRIDSNTVKGRSLKPNSKNVATRAYRFFETLPSDSKKIVIEWASQESKESKKKARECARLENYHEAEHWRAVSVFTDQLRRLLAR